MEQQYLVSARKYRPTTFDSVVGQEALTTTLKNAILNGKLAHAYLFCGPRGVGKTTCARIFAKTINCMNPHDGEACNECESCKSFNEGRSFNIYELDAASNNSVEDIRSITEQVHIPPQLGKYKVYIIDEVHMLSSAAFNAFLKTLEEPPKYVIFILATTEKHKLLPTILSRCQIYDFNRMEVSDIISHLSNVAARENIEVEKEALNVIARKADGGMRDALSIFDQVASYCNGKITYAGTIANLNILDYEYYFQVTDKILEKKIPDVLVLLDEIIRKGFDPGLFINGLADHFRDLLVSRDKVTLPLLQVSEEVRGKYYEQASRIKPGFLYSALRICNECDLNYKASRNKRLQVELALIMVSQLDENGEEPSSGRCPKIIKPIFTVNVQQDAVHRADVSASGAQTEPDVQPGHFAERNEKINPVKKVTAGKIGFSIKNYVVNPPAKSGNKSVRMIVNETGVGSGDYEDKEIDEYELGIQWRLLGKLMPQEDKAIGIRMQNMKPRLVQPTVFQVEVETDKVQELIESRRDYILEHLRQAMSNHKLDMRTSIMDIKKIHIAVTPAEKYQEMCKLNPDFAGFVKELGLKIR